MRRVGDRRVGLGGVAPIPEPAFARGLDCTELPEYYRAVGTIENGEGSCGMTTAEARRILARGNPEHAAEEPPRPRPRAHHRRKAPRG